MADKVLATWIETAERTPTLDVLPPGLDAPTWAALVAKFQVILGEDGVLTGHEHRVRYGDPYAEHQDGREQEKRASAAALFPVTVEHIQAILKLCNEHKVPVWTVSQGKNLGYGGPAARVKVSGLGVASMASVLTEAGLHHPRPAAHDQGHRGQRPLLVLHCRAGRHLLRHLQGHPGAEQEHLVLRSGLGLGLRRRQCSRQRVGLHACW